jgi:hypothetical protein
MVHGIRCACVSCLIAYWTVVTAVVALTQHAAACHCSHLYPYLRGAVAEYIALLLCLTARVGRVMAAVVAASCNAWVATPWNTLSAYTWYSPASNTARYLTAAEEHSNYMTVDCPGEGTCSSMNAWGRLYQRI